MPRSPSGQADLYVAVTRTTRRLVVLSEVPLSDVLACGSQTGYWVAIAPRMSSRAARRAGSSAATTPAIAAIAATTVNGPAGTT